MAADEHQPLRRVGRDVAAAEYWTGRAGAYASEIGGPYHAHRLRVIDRLLEPLDIDGATVVDFGCGEGVLVEQLAAQGARVIGFDPVAELVTASRERMEAASLPADIRQGGTDDLFGMADASVDVLLALNVLAYLGDDECERFYGEAARIVRPGGSFVVTHSNELFDLMTLNRYTVDFHARHLFGADSVPAIASLLTHPNEPDRVTFNVRANPLSYRYVLEAHGFDEQQQEFINLHPLPPLLMPPEVFVDIDARTYDDTLDWPPGERWKLLFTCSMFGSRSTRRR